MVSFLLLHWARSYARTGLLGVDPPSYLVARYSSVEGIVRPTGYFVPTVRPSAGGMLTRCFALFLGLGRGFA